MKPKTRSRITQWTDAAFELRTAGPVIVAAALLASGCRSAKITGEQQLTASPVEKASVVYIADFGLVPDEIENANGVLSKAPLISRRARDLLYGQKPPTQRAREMVELMSTSLVKDIGKAGYTTLRYNPETPVPTNGWLVRGTYTKVQQGNRLRRVLFGLGEGKTYVQVVTVFDNLSKGPPQPLYEVATDSNSGKAPGAAPTLVFGPYAAAARFVLAGNDLDRDVRKTAAKIAEGLEREIARAQ